MFEKGLARKFLFRQKCLVLACLALLSLYSSILTPFKLSTIGSKVLSLLDDQQEDRERKEYRNE